MHIAFGGRNWRWRLVVAGIILGLSVPASFTLAGARKDSEPGSKSERAEMKIVDVVSRGIPAIVPASPASADDHSGDRLVVLRVKPEVAAPYSPVILEVYLRDPSGGTDRYIGGYGFHPPPQVGEVRKIYLPLLEIRDVADLLAGAKLPDIVVRLFESKLIAPVDNVRIRVLDARIYR